MLLKIAASLMVLIALPLWAADGSEITVRAAGRPIHRTTKKQYPCWSRVLSTDEWGETVTVIKSPPFSGSKSEVQLKADQRRDETRRKWARKYYFTGDMIAPGLYENTEMLESLYRTGRHDPSYKPIASDICEWFIRPSVDDPEPVRNLINAHKAGHPDATITADMLFRAVHSPRVLQELLRHPSLFSLEARSNAGLTPLGYAVSKVNIIGVQALITAGANVNARRCDINDFENQSGVSILEDAITHARVAPDRYKIAEALIAAGAIDPKAQALITVEYAQLSKECHRRRIAWSDNPFSDVAAAQMKRLMAHYYAYSDAPAVAKTRCDAYERQIDIKAAVIEQVAAKGPYIRTRRLLLVS
ncbi:MAG TPA: ankyrin repeat domain-containing protein [Candidatus Babeliales bacterium]|nr:ankyrin repeat domain-containing protein [Candidatus Babeliales bacterium]